VKKADAPEPSYEQAATVPIGSTGTPYVYDTASARTQPYTQQIPVPPGAAAAQGYPQSGAIRRDTGTFLPYAAAGAAGVDKPKDQRAWLIPVIIGAAVVLLGLVLLSAYLVISNRTSTPTTAGAPTQSNGPAGGPVANPNESLMAEPSPTALPPNASDEDKLREVIYRSNENQILSWENLDTEVLKKNYTGPALDENISQVQELKQQGMYAKPKNQKLEILDVKATGDQAIAHTQEEWVVTFYNKADNKQISQQSYSLSETYHFVKQDGTWYINKLDIPDTTPTPGSGG